MWGLGKGGLCYLSLIANGGIDRVEDLRSMNRRWSESTGWCGNGAKLNVRPEGGRGTMKL